MAITLGDVRDPLLAGDAELKQLAQEHTHYDSQLQQLSSSLYLSSEDILLEAKLKKMKLRVKDQMEKRLARLSRSRLLH